MMHPLRYSSLANNGAFGLEYLLTLQKNNRTQVLLNDGMKLLCTIDERIDDNTMIDQDKLEKYEVQKMVLKCFDEYKLKEMIHQSNINKEILTEIICTLEVKEITARKLQHFFNEISSCFLDLVMKERKENNVSIF